MKLYYVLQLKYARLISTVQYHAAFKYNHIEELVDVSNINVPTDHVQQNQIIAILCDRCEIRKL